MFDKIFFILIMIISIYVSIGTINNFNFSIHSERHNSLIKEYDKKYIEDIVITDKLKSEAIGLIIDKYKIIDQELYFLDDRSEYLGEVKNKFPEIKTVLIKRPEGRYDDDMDKHCDFEAKNLQQVEKIIHGK